MLIQLLLGYIAKNSLHGCPGQIRIIFYVFNLFCIAVNNTCVMFLGLESSIFNFFHCVSEVFTLKSIQGF